MALQFVIEKGDRTVGWRYSQPGQQDQAIDLSPEEAKIAAMIDQTEVLRSIADGLRAIAHAVRDTKQ